MQMQQQKQQSDHNIYNHINIRIHYKNKLIKIQQYQLDTNNNNKNSINVENILKIIKQVIYQKKIQTQRFLNIFVQIDKKLVNLYKLKRSKLQSGIKIKKQNSNFNLDIHLIQIGSQQQKITNPQFQLSTQKTKLNIMTQKLKRTNQIFHNLIQSIDQSQRYTYDVVYFFAQPLVKPDKEFDFTSRKIIQQYQNIKDDSYNNIKQSQYAVTIIKQYDKFINVLKQKIFQNIKVGMKVATESNINNVLIEKCNIIQFAAHGFKTHINIQRQKQLGFQNILTAEKLIKLLKDKKLPKIIIFNVCYSSEIAKQIHQKYPQITTIGYNDKINDKSCQFFTQNFYRNLYEKQNKNIAQVFYQIKNIMEKSQNLKQVKQAAKFQIFYQPEYSIFKQNINKFTVKQNWNKNWDKHQNLGLKDPIKIKKELYLFIKQYLLDNQKPFFFVYGQKQSGKTYFMKKAALYTINRGRFHKKIQIDCKDCHNMLQFKLKKHKKLIHQLQESRKNNLHIILILDNCDQIIKNQPNKFLIYIKKINLIVNYGKIAIISQSIQPLLKNYKHLIKYHKKIVYLGYAFQDMNFYLLQWYSEHCKDFFNFMKQKKIYQHYKVSTCMKALQNIKIYGNFQKSFLKIQETQKNQQLLKLKLFEQDKKFNQLLNQIYLQINLSQKKLKKILKNEHHYRSVEQFPLLNFFPDFPFFSNNNNENNSSFVIENNQSQTKQLIQKLLKGLQIFLNYSNKKIEKNQRIQDLKQIKLHLQQIIQKLFIVINFTFLSGKKSQIQQQLFNCYEFIIKILNCGSIITNLNQKLIVICESINLKIIMTLYCIYKNQYFKQIEKKQLKNCNKMILHSQQNYNYHNNYNQHQNNIIAYSQNIQQTHQILQNQSFNRQTIKQIQQFESIKQKYYEFDEQTKYLYEKTQYWDLIIKIKQMDTRIRIIQLQNNPYLSSVQNQQYLLLNKFGKIQYSFNQIESFYQLYDKIYESVKQLEKQENYKKTIMINFILTKNQLNLVYLVGLKLIKKFMNFIDNQFLLEQDLKCKQMFYKIGQRFCKIQRILNKILDKITKQFDLSYKKIYKQYIQIFIVQNFKFQRDYRQFSNTNHKQSILVFNKLLKLSEKGRFLQIKDKIQQYIQKTFYNICTILISQPLVYIQKFHQKTKHDNKKKQTKKKSKNYQKKQQKNQQKDIKIHIVNSIRYSQLIEQKFKNKVQNEVFTQIHIQIETFTYQKHLKKKQNQFNDQKKERLIYFIMCDCYDNQKRQAIFIQNQKAQSIKLQFTDRKGIPRKQQFSLPYAPVIIWYGSKTDIVKLMYRKMCQQKGKKMAFISLNTNPKKPDIQGTFEQIQSNSWKQYLQKQISIKFLSYFWPKFCKVYFDYKHETFQIQALTSYNIAKKESLISLKKFYSEGIQKNEILDFIDTFFDFKGQTGLNIGLLSVNYNDPSINFTRTQDQNIQLSIGKDEMPNLSQRFSDSENLSSSQVITIRRQQQIMALSYRQIGVNLQIHNFLSKLFKHYSECQNNFKKSQFYWIKFTNHINETNLNIFAKTLSYKLNRIGQFSEGVYLYDMSKLDFQKQQRLIKQSFIKNQQIIQCPERKKQNNQMNNTRFQVLKKKKRFQIYYDINIKILSNILLDNKNDSEIKNSNKRSQNKQVNYEQSIQIYYLFIVESNPSNSEQKQISRKYVHTLLKNSETINVIQNHYHICDSILQFSKKIDNFEFANKLNSIFTKKQMKQEIKKKHPKQLKQKIITFFKRKG